LAGGPKLSAAHSGAWGITSRRDCDRIKSSNSNANNMSDNFKLREQVLRILQDEPVLSLATASADGQPHLTFVFFSVDDKMNMYFLTREATRKAQNIEINPRVAFAVGQRPPASVQGTGIASRLTDPEEQRRAKLDIAEVAVKADSPWPPLLNMSAGDYVLYKITPRSIKVVDLTSRTINTDKPILRDLEL
jgi:nitroimidazol reductase NimA-like FMN-containing flavoprotein (pyridoxamine 5'-phosphate oxidase superfamily)